MKENWIVWLSVSCLLFLIGAIGSVVFQTNEFMFGVSNLLAFTGLVLLITGLLVGAFTKEKQKTK